MTQSDTKELETRLRSAGCLAPDGTVMHTMAVTACEIVTTFLRDHDTAPPQSVPEGKWMPPVPTAEMLERAAHNLSESYGPDRVRGLGQFARDLYAEFYVASPTPQPVGGGDGALVTPLPGAYIKFLPDGRMEIGHFHFHTDGDFAVGMANLVRDSLTAAAWMPIAEKLTPDAVDLDALEKALFDELEPAFRDHSWMSFKTSWIDMDYWRTENGERKKAKLRVNITKLAHAAIRSLRQSTATKGPKT